MVCVVAFTFSSFLLDVYSIAKRRFSSFPGGCGNVRSVRARFLRQILEYAHAHNALRTRQCPALGFAKV